MISGRCLAVIAQEARAASEAKTKFMKRMAHDIRTPFNAIKGCSEIAAAHIDNRVETLRQLDRVGLSIDVLSRLADDVLDLTLIEKGEVSLVLEPLVASVVFSGFEQSIVAPLLRGNITFTSDYSWCDVHPVLMDSLGIQQICADLLSNAFKFTRDGGEMRLAVSTEPVACSDKVQLTISVSDNGEGMTPEFMEHMYERFMRGEDARVNPVRGSGLGLAIVHDLVSLMGGSIDCESRPGAGTTFTVRLTLDRAREEAVDDADAADNLPDCSGMRVLVAEDNDLNTRSARSSCRCMA
ncbi:HAMP domain-containing sensor histidine kinase [Paratractidigestivibacter sp.]|uniref:sensor histidine kinase n=2 Tax=Paratractidigestivibacter sp. TaxID=2847316 RepID=UPI002ABDC5CD|nr:HAMP domain-containing sensor histidine kinase [Paratractidigestivibacter sp.]